MRTRRGAVAVLVVTASVAPAQLTFDVSGASGSFWLYGPDGQDLIYRMSLNVGVSPTVVHAVGNADVAQGVAPAEGEFAESAKEWVVVFTDADGNPAGIEAVQRIYQWSGANRLVARYRLRNRTDAGIEPYVSFEIIPTLEGYRQYGGETADFLPEHEIGYMHEVGKFLGLKVASSPLFSYRTPGYAEYEDASDKVAFRYAQMSNPENSSFPITDDYGLMVFLNAGAHEIAPGESVDVYVVIGYGTSPEGMAAEILTAQAAYDAWFNSVHESAPATIVLGETAPNPCRGTTRLTLVLREATSARVEICDVVGRVVSVLFSGSLPAGTHRLTWAARTDDGTPVPSGVYTWVIRAGDHTHARRIVVVR